jgi:hypothetical protein
LEESHHGLIMALSQNLPGRIEEIHENTSDRIAKNS